MIRTIDDHDEELTPKIVGVDRNNLEIEVSHVSRMVYDYGVYLADAEDRMDRAKVRWKRKRKELANTVRDDPAEFGLPGYGKPNNDQIYEVVDNNDEVVELEDAFLDAKHLFNRISAAVEAFNTKRFSLSWALKLWSQSYYADNPVPDHMKDRMLDAERYEGVYEELAKQRRKKE